MGKLLARLKNQKGVTLIELLTVIVILGIIAAIAIPSFAGSRGQAVSATNDQNYQLVSDALNRYSLASNGQFPNDLATLVPQYIQTIPNPLNGNGTAITGDNNGWAYTWGTSNKNTTYHLDFPAGADHHITPQNSVNAQ